MTATSKLQQLGYLIHHGIDDDDAFWQMTPAKQVQDARYVRAVREYQFANAENIDPLIGTYYPDRSAAVVHADGILGPATGQALEHHMDCACGEYPAADAAHDGDTSGPWGPCHTEGIYFSVDYDGQFGLAMPEWLRSIWGEVKANAVEAYRLHGSRLRETEWNHPTQVEHIRVSFVSHPPGWIGLAEYPARGTCQQQRFNKLNLRYRPSSNHATMVDQWSRLFVHELGHNHECQHTRGGVMNPSIVWGPWDGITDDDPMSQILHSKYGDELPHDSTPPEPPAQNWWNKYRLSDAGGNLYVFAEINPGQSVTGFELTDPTGKTVEIREVS